MCILVLAVVVAGDQLSPINAMGLFVCLLGISGHIIHKFTSSFNGRHKITSINYPSRISDDEYVVTETLEVSSSFDNRDTNIFRRNAKNKFDSIPLLAQDNENMSRTSLLAENNDDQSCDSDNDSNVILDVLHRRDTVR